MLGWDPAIDLSAIRDDLSCQAPGWSFPDHSENRLSGAYKAMARRAWSSIFRGQALAKAGHWLPGPCFAYLEAGAKMAKQGFSASHISSGLPGRATETTGIRFRNTKLVMRNIYIREGQVMIIISYNKARASTNHAFYVVRYLLDELGLSFVTYVAYIRLFLDFLATQLAAAVTQQRIPLPRLYAQEEASISLAGDRGSEGPDSDSVDAVDHLALPPGGDSDCKALHPRPD